MVEIADFLTYPASVCRPRCGLIPSELHRDHLRHKTRVKHCLRDRIFSHFDRTPTCDRQTDGHTMMTSYIMLA